jgi:hypothetical protein
MHWRAKRFTTTCLSGFLATNSYGADELIQVNQSENAMLRNTAVVLLLLWLLTLLSPMAIGNLVHSLVVLAIILLVVDFFLAKA